MIEQSIEDSLLALEELVQINLSITREKDLHLLLDKILTAARKLTAAEAGCIYILDRTKRYLHPEVIQGDYLQNSVVPLHKVDLRPDRRPNMEAITAYTALSGQIVNISDVYTYSGFNFDDLYHRDRLSGIRTRSLLVIPLTDYEGVSLGVMQLFNRRVSEKGEVEAFPAKLEAFVRAFAVQAVVVAENTRLLVENRNLIVQLDETNQVLQIENEALRNRMSGKLMVDEIIGQSAAMKKVFSLIEKIADSTATALIQGETGTGKELIAACVHRNGPHRDGPFIAQNCAALPEDLLESELFGYRKGAFSGATNHKKGLIEAAEGGTLFLDEIGDMPLKLQAKILRVLQEREVRPLGSLESIPVNIRVLAATHQDLPKLIEQGRFREDLFYRLNVFPIELPPLRERRDDIPALVHHFICQFSQQYGKPISGIKPQVFDLILSLPLPGNIRELRNIVERAVLLADQEGVIEPQHLTGYETHEVPVTPLEQELENGASLKDIMGRLEARVIARHLQRHNGNQTRTADALGVSRRSLVEKLGRYDLREKNCELN
ncbi:sigma 54-interacting transcriptional regulator [Amphritea sp.]|uniref:sigma 54-interacting transcriptional regulator n=1 Tax=Amphritea sp. TaxID=1872502 RepID=UPI003D0F1802